MVYSIFFHAGEKKLTYPDRRPIFTQSDFHRQLAAHNAPPTKKFKSSTPKGVKLGEGYTDRAKTRETAGVDAEIADRERRLEAVKELARNTETGEVDMELVIQQSKAMGGDIKSTHLVKGLDFALLERVKRGEDVLGLSTGGKEARSSRPDGGEARLEDELDRALDKMVIPMEKVKAKKVGKRVTREDMLAELKRQKAEAVTTKKAQPPSILDSRFKKIGQPKAGKKETNRNGKSRDKKARALESSFKKNKLGTALGMLPPPLPTATVAKGEDDLDIFEDAGREYNPLASLEDEEGSGSDSSSDEDEAFRPANKPEEHEEKTTDIKESNAASFMPTEPRPKPNYFLESDDDKEEHKPSLSTSAFLIQNPDLAAALAKAAKLVPPAQPSAEEQEKEQRRRAMLENFDRDAVDIDMGFGGSRDWGDDEEFVEEGKGKKRKRGPKGRKGDKNDAALVSRIATEKYGKASAPFGT